MKVYLINSEACEVTEAEISEQDTLSFAQKAVGGYIEAAHQLNNGDTFFCDEEGLFKGYESGFLVKGAHQPFAGSGILMGFDRETGDSISVKTPIEEIKSMINFLRFVKRDGSND
jgi:hypothetical protein